MSDERYHFNSESLSYDKVKLTFKQKIVRIVLPQIAAGVVIAFVLFILASYFVHTREERALIRENRQLDEQYQVLSERIDQTTKVLEDIESRDRNIYRAIFESEPSPVLMGTHEEKRQNEYYEKLEGMKNNRLVKETRNRLVELRLQLQTHKLNFEQLATQLKSEREKLRSIPSTQPIANRGLKHLPYGYGMRIDPVYKTPSFHHGIDFAAPKGTKIYATADGVISRAAEQRNYGKYVKIKHGQGYETLYAHMSKVLVRRGQKVKRGELIGLVGDTGKAICSHIHYEVHRDGKTLNPINFFFEDLSPHQYDQIIQLASMSGQALD